MTHTANRDPFFGPAGFQSSRTFLRHVVLPMTVFRRIVIALMFFLFLFWDGVQPF